MHRGPALLLMGGMIALGDGCSYCKSDREKVEEDRPWREEHWRDINSPSRTHLQLWLEDGQIVRGAGAEPRLDGVFRSIQIRAIDVGGRGDRQDVGVSFSQAIGGGRSETGEADLQVTLGMRKSADGNRAEVSGAFRYDYVGKWTYATVGGGNTEDTWTGQVSGSFDPQNVPATVELTFSGQFVATGSESNAMRTKPIHETSIWTRVVRFKVRKD